LKGTILPDPVLQLNHVLDKERPRGEALQYQAHLIEGLELIGKLPRLNNRYIRTMTILLRGHNQSGKTSDPFLAVLEKRQCGDG
jgi:hypothetical protein